MTPRGGILAHGAPALVLSPPANRTPGRGGISLSNGTPAEEVLELHEFDLPPEPALSALAVDPQAHAGLDWATREQALDAEFEIARRAAEASAYQRGLAEGRAQGRAEAGQALAEPAAALLHAHEQLRAQERTFLGTLEDNLAALGVAIARQIIGREVNTDPAAIAQLVRRAIAEFPVDQPLRIRLHPTDLALVTAARGDDDAPLAIVGSREVTWLADPRIERGGSVIESRERIVDGRVDTALERVFRKLTRVST